MIKRYDCGKGRAQFCQGCYQMEEDTLGDYAKVEDILEQLEEIESLMDAKGVAYLMLRKLIEELQ